MKAVVLTKDSIEFSVQDVEAPKAGKGEVIVRVKAFAINRVDLIFRDSWLNSSKLSPHVLGTDFAGVIHELGIGVGNINIGDRVLVNTGISCMQCSSCRKGEQSLCNDFQILGYNVWGGAAEYVKVPSHNVLKIPDTLSFELAAAAPLTTLTVYRMLVSKARLCPGELVLVLGAGGGVGTTAIQMVKAMGGRVIALTSSEKVLKVKALGADIVLDYKKDLDWDKKILEFSPGVDITIDPVGESTWEKSLQVLAKGGRHVVIGATTGTFGSMQIRELYSKQAYIMGSYMSNNREFVEAMQFIFNGQIKPVIDSIQPMDKLGDGIEKMARNLHVGKLVFTVD
ncbi:MAG: zinc-binding dehydrogenase [Candidatus Kariarchaeaceae archaeon]|jgi:NADPH:quinone reductase-like Zn-dependent oxidoreductase